MPPPASFTVFAAGSTTHRNHPDVAPHEDRATKRISKHFSSVFDDTDLAAWLREGPPMARVEDLERLPARDEEVGEGFITV